MQENETEERGISIGDIFRIIFSRKWLALIIAAAITIVGTTGLYLLGKYKSVYTVTFAMQLPNSTDSPISYKYPDGSVFHYTDLISSDNIIQTVEDNEQFSNINTEKMLRKGDISILREMLETAQGSGNYVANYSISIRAKYFNSEEQANAFISELVRLPEKHIAGMQIKYDDNLDSAAAALTFGDQLDFLKAQFDKIRSGYTSFINTYGASFVVKDGKTLEGYRTDLDAFAKSSNSIDILKAELVSSYYIKSEEALNKYQNDLILKNREIEIKKNTLKNIDASDSSTKFTDIAAYIELNNSIGQLQLEIDDLTAYLENGITSGAAFDRFKANVESLQSKLAVFTDDYETVAQTIYSSETASYPGELAVVSEGELGLVKSLIISLVVGIIVAMIAAYIAGVAKIRKSKNIQSQTPALTVIEAQAQAAATKDDEQPTN